jgi:hypothetical protein
MTMNNEIRPFPTLRIVDKSVSDALAVRQAAAAAGIGRRYAFHPDNEVRRSTGTLIDLITYCNAGGDLNAL